MQSKNLPIHSDRAIEDVLLQRAGVSHLRQRYILLEEAQRQAKNVIKSANKEVQALHYNAWVTGYERGLLTALDAVIHYFRESQNREVAFYKRAEENITALLSDIFNSNDVFLSVLEKWSCEFNEYNSSNETIFLLIPECCRRLKPQMVDLLHKERNWKIHIEYHQDIRFVMRFRDHIAEYCPENITEKMVCTLLSDFADFSLDSLSEDCVQMLKKLFTSGSEQEN